MHNDQPRSLTLPALLLLLLPLPAQAALTPVGAPLAIADETPCFNLTALEAIATPKGAFEVVWVDDFVEVVKGRRFARNLQPAGPVTILPLHGGLFPYQLAGTWAGRYAPGDSRSGGLLSPPPALLSRFRAALSSKRTEIFRPAAWISDRVYLLCLSLSMLSLSGEMLCYSRAEGAGSPAGASGERE